MAEPSELVRAVREAVVDPSVAAVAIEHELQPVEGPGAAVAPPTYPTDVRGEVAHPYSPTGTIPTADGDGWLTGVALTEAGRPVQAPSVILDDVQAQSARASEELWHHRVALGGLPGFVVYGSDSTAAPTGGGTVDELVNEVALSSWQASHRHADSWIQTAATTPGGTPVWKSNDGGMRDVLTGINSTVDASSAFQYAPNALLYGYWLSSGSSRLHKQARAYRSRIVGYGAEPVYSAASKVDPLPTSKNTVLDRPEFGAEKKGDRKPSNLGFGSTPGSVDVRAYVCERIAARGSLSLSQLRSIRYGSDERSSAKQTAAATAVTILGLAGDALLRRRTFLRSGCDLVSVTSRYGLRVQGRTTPDPLPVEMTASPEWWGHALEAALQDCREAGLDFAAPVELYLSAPQRAMLSDGAEALRTGTAVEEQ